jgi:hypothetical protein
MNAQSFCLLIETGVAARDQSLSNVLDSDAVLASRKALHWIRSCPVGVSSCLPLTETPDILDKFQKFAA